MLDTVEAELLDTDLVAAELRRDPDGLVTVIEAGGAAPRRSRGWAAGGRGVFPVTGLGAGCSPSPGWGRFGDASSS
ncbi:unnamed protein product [Urochloa humidicola]